MTATSPFLSYALHLLWLAAVAPWYQVELLSLDKEQLEVEKEMAEERAEQAEQQLQAMQAAGAHGGGEPPAAARDSADQQQQMADLLAQNVSLRCASPSFALPLPWLTPPPALPSPQGGPALPGGAGWGG